VTGLVGWWPLHENSGSTARDLSGNGNHGTLNGGVTQGVAGKGGLTSYSFDGNDDYVDISGAYGAKNLGFTISAWAYRTDSLSSDRNVLSGEESGQRVIGIGGKSSSEIAFGAYDGDGHGISTSMDKYSWHHILGTVKSNGEMEFFVNGQSVGTNSTSQLSNNTPEWYIGSADRADSPGYWPGRISDVRIYDRVLSKQEIQTLYDWGSGDYTDEGYHDSSDPGAVSRWEFDDDSDTTTATDSWTSNPGNVVNGANFVSDSIRGKAISFDGSNYVDLGSSVFPSGAKTLAAWFKYESGGLASGDAYLFEQEDSNGDIQSLYYNDDTEIIFLNSGNIEVQYSRTISPDVWNFVAYTYDSSQSRLYFNGSLVDKGSGSDTDNANNTGLGTKRLGEGLWKGKLDDARIYNRALSPSEVFQLYQWGTRGRDMRKLTVNKR
jgi:hypothetical protein